MTVPSTARNVPLHEYETYVGVGWNTGDVCRRADSRCRTGAGVLAVRLLTARGVRLIKIESLLRRGIGRSLDDLLDALHTSEATFKRDLSCLRVEFGAPIQWDRYTNTYRLVGPWQGVASALIEQARI